MPLFSVTVWTPGDISVGVVDGLTVLMNNLGDGIAASYAFFNNISYTKPKVPTIYSVLSSGDLATNAEVYGEYTHPMVLAFWVIIRLWWLSSTTVILVPIHSISTGTTFSFSPDPPRMGHISMTTWMVILSHTTQATIMPFPSFLPNETRSCCRLRAILVSVLWLITLACGSSIATLTGIYQKG